ncbi:hypothetical protein RIE95_07740 [Acidithiobacillus thiooxidans]|uniref:hypothetical protein n=1 Tax=Acidithiobacillus thiooxidans TaxID=930 RepID=UPI0028583C1F|nr:hypothetical protein [Acidithiobacillus thiooxidans]MDR7926872.1 hypothetical protein [Acidithiobacillus thiooxidans]
MHRKEDFRSTPTQDFLEFFAEETHLEPKPLTRAPIRGWIQFAFWGLRIYIVAMSYARKWCMGALQLA